MELAPWHLAHVETFTGEIKEERKRVEVADVVG